jgi:hypothetical protein
MASVFAIRLDEMQAFAKRLYILKIVTMIIITGLTMTKSEKKKKKKKKGRIVCVLPPFPNAFFHSAHPYPPPPGAPHSAKIITIDHLGPAKIKIKNQSTRRCHEKMPTHRMYRFWRPAGRRASAKPNRYEFDSEKK